MNTKSLVSIPFGMLKNSDSFRRQFACESQIAAYPLRNMRKAGANSRGAGHVGSRNSIKTKHCGLARSLEVSGQQIGNGNMKTKSTHSKLGLFVCAAVVPFAVGATSAHAGGISAGTLIENTASATYDDGDGPKTVDSNTVVLRVDELLDVTVTSLDPGAIGGVPGETVLTFEVTNQGNGPEAFELTVDPTVAGNDFDTVVEDIAVDTNGNGTYDPGVDQILTAPETTDLLDADEAVTVFVIVTVPNGVTDGQESDVELTATAATGSGAPGTVFAGQGVDGGDAIVGSTGASASANGTIVVGITSVGLTKSATVVDSFGGDSAVPGSVVTFTITANVAGSGSVDDLIITDAIPDGTTYNPGTLALGGAGLTDAAGDDAGEASDAAGITVDLGTVAGGTSQSITFDVTID